MVNWIEKTSFVQFGEEDIIYKDKEESGCAKERTTGDFILIFSPDIIDKKLFNVSLCGNCDNILSSYEIKGKSKHTYKEYKVKKKYIEINKKFKGDDWDWRLKESELDDIQNLIFKITYLRKEEKVII